jgi:hypothetical protein
MESITRQSRLENKSSELLDLWKFYNRKVLPFKGKIPDFQTCERQRKTKEYKKSPNGYFLEAPTADEVLEWEGIGLFLGDIIVLDVDDTSFLNIPEVKQALMPDGQLIMTPMVATCSGYHFYFKPPRKALEMPTGRKACPLLNSKDSPCYIGRGEVACLKTNGVVALPPTGGKAYLEGRSALDVEPVEIPEALLTLLWSIPRKVFHSKKTSPMETTDAISYGKTQIQEISPMEKSLDTIPTPTEIPYSADNYKTLKLNPLIKDFLLNPESLLIKKLVEKLGGTGERIPCPYDPPDKNWSGSFTCLSTGWKGWVFTDWHTHERLPIAQVISDLYTGYLKKVKDGEPDPYRHYVTLLGMEERESISLRWKVKPEAWVWLTLLAGDTGLIELPALKLEALDADKWTSDELKILHFIDRWASAHFFTFGTLDFPLAKSWLVSVCQGVRNPGDNKTDDWKDAYKTVDTCLSKARTRNVLRRTQKGVRGFGGKPAFYQVLKALPESERSESPERLGDIIDLDAVKQRLKGND